MPTMLAIEEDIETTRASRAGHTFHERWAARRALQLVFPSDKLFAIAVEGISPTETSSPGTQAEEVADLVLYYGQGDNFQTCERLETIQFKYKLREEAVTASYLKKTIKKFADTILGYEKEFSEASVNKKTSFIFVTNAKFKEHLWDAIKSITEGTKPSIPGAAGQAQHLRKWCAESGLTDASRLFSRTVFRAGEKSLAGQDSTLRRTLTDWSAGADVEARLRLHALKDLVLKKAGPSGQAQNLIRREDVLDALDCEPEDLFPADTRFIDVGAVVERVELSMVSDLIKEIEHPIFVHAEGGVGKTVFVQSLASKMASEFEVIVFDCFGGGSYRSDNHSRHLPKIGLVQIINELASRMLCDPLLPGGDDSRKIIKATCKRLAQAAAAIRAQSEKCGLLIIIDAADNAHFEANNRHEESFPNLILAALSEDPIDGVRLLLTARTHRKDKVIGRATVSEVELGPFTDVEAREFLKDRKPSASDVGITTALARSGRNARVLDYLVQTWDTNVLDRPSADLITVPEIIAQSCAKIVEDLRVVGWAESEVTEFFVALSLLPPPIPLDDLANSLGWSLAQVNTAASDLAPMLEITSHGAIFRDEPTETYIRETYAEQPEAQRVIADRLLHSQATSAYAAEALPHFLVVIHDSDRAFALVNSTSFPASVQSEFGRRRLTLARLRAAFRLAVSESDFDRVLDLSMRLAQAVTVNMRGDEFIRNSPALAIILGDGDSYRRLFADRSGWRGARSARLTIAHRFAGNDEEAQIQCESTIRWINWQVTQPREDTHHDYLGPDVKDFTAVLFQHVIEGRFDTADNNLANWSDRFSLSVSDELLQLLELFDLAKGTKVLPNFVSFIASDQCTSKALKLCLFSWPHCLDRQQVKSLVKSIGAIGSRGDGQEDFSSEPDKQKSGDVIQAALTALIYCSRTAAAVIIRHSPRTRPTAYEYSERYGHSRAWAPILRACVRAWSTGKRATYHDLLPEEVKVAQQARTISSKMELVAFLKELREATPTGPDKKGGKRQVKAKFNDLEREEISTGIELALTLIRPIEDAVFSGKGFTSACVSDFLNVWKEHTREAGHWRSSRASDLLVRTVGLGGVDILLSHAPTISTDQAKALISLISAGQFSDRQKMNVLSQLAKRPPLHELAGEFAQHITEQILQDDSIERRGDAYVELAAALVPMSIEEAREYYLQGLAQLDQMGGESYDQIYSLLRFASVQKGGLLKPVLAQRLMNLCQAIARDEPSKFGWTLFARAAAQSIGFPAIAKLVRWHNQEVSDLSYGLPQLACFLAQNRHLDPRRAAFLLMICKDHGWWDWRSGDGVADLMKLSNASDQRRIFLAVLTKLRAEYPSGAWPELWKSFLETGNLYSNAITPADRKVLEQLKAEAKRNRDELNSRNSSSQSFLTAKASKPRKEEVDDIITAIIRTCDPYSASSIDEALRAIKADDRLPYDAWHSFIVGLRTSCLYSKRLAFLFAICQATELDLTQTLDVLVECFTDWIPSSQHLATNAKSLVEKLFESKSVQMFDDQFANITRDIRRLSDFCSDNRFVLQLVLRKIAADEVELDGDEWLQLATALCDVASNQAALDALELLLSGPASRIADEIGEGPLRPEQEIKANEAEFISDVTWHLLGDDDSYIRWSVARELNTLVELGLKDDLDLLLDRFEQREIRALASADRTLAFQNSQQWLLMGLARAALHHGRTMVAIRPKLLALAKRSDLHVIHKVHIARCLEHIDDGARNAELDSLLNEISQPPCGTAISDDYPPAAIPTSDFHFGYEFTKHEISALARLFNIPQTVAEDAIAAEITRLWPEASSLDFFPGRARYEWELSDRYEFYQEHIQKHALLSAATNLSKKLPVAIRSYETWNASPWLEWRDRYDVTFNDGSWLSDRKDPIPQPAKENLLGQRIDQQETLQDQHTVLLKLGFSEVALDSLLPLYGRWSSPDGVTVSIVSALTEPRGAIGRCTAFAKRPYHDIWLPQFWEQGYYDPRSRSENPFAPLVWAPEPYNLGIDVGDEIAAEGAAGRPRLGIDLTTNLGLINDPNSGDWYTTDGNLALKSQVWGSWQPDSDNRRHRHHDNGEILWASPDWIAATLSALNRKLVFTVSLWKYQSSRSYTTSRSVKSVFIGLRVDDEALRFWQAKKASKQDD